MFEPVWLSFLDVIEIGQVVGETFPDHPVVLLAHKHGDLEAGIFRPVTHYAYNEERDLTMLAAHYVYGIGAAHAYMDGNKRIAFSSATTFLMRNGLALREPVEGFFAEPVERLIAGALTIENLADLIADHLELIEEDAE